MLKIPRKRLMKVVFCRFASKSRLMLLDYSSIIDYLLFYRRWNVIWLFCCDSYYKVSEAKTGICSSSSAKLVGENNASKALDSFKQSSYDESKAVEEGEEYDYCDDTEEHFKEVASFEATFVIIDAYKSPMKPVNADLDNLFWSFLYIFSVA